MDTKFQSTWPLLQPAAVDLQKILLAVPHMQAAGMKAALAEQREMLSFVKHRCDQDLVLTEQLSEAEDVKSIYEALLRFYEAAATDYVAELSRVSRVGSRAVRKAAAEIRQEAEPLADQAKARSRAA